MPSAEAYLAHLAGDVGYKESPVNRTKFAAQAGHLDGYAWCATFLVAGARATGLRLAPGTESGYTPTQEAAFKRAGALHTTPRPGDWFFLFFPSQGVVGHVGAVTRVRGNLIDTIEGNTNNDGSAEGLYVMRRTRSWGAVNRRAYVRSFGRPVYAATGAQPAPHQEDDMFSDLDRIHLQHTMRSVQSMHRGGYMPVPVDKGEPPAPAGDLSWLDEKIATAVRETIHAVLADVGEKVWDGEQIAVRHPLTDEAQKVSMRIAAGRSASVVRDAAKAITAAPATPGDAAALAAAVAASVPDHLAQAVHAALGARITPTRPATPLERR